MNLTANLDRPSLDTLIEKQGRDLADQLAKHRLISFPPTAKKEFRRLNSGEAAAFLDVTESYLRQTASDIFGPTQPSQNRRSYDLGDLAALRGAMAAKSRTPLKFTPQRREGEHLQSIAVVNFKGGSAKTTTAVNLAQYLALRGYRVLAIDLDPQASLTTLFGVAPETDVEPNSTLYGLVRFDNPSPDPQTVIRKTYFPTLDLIPGAIELMEYEHDAPRAMMTRAPGARPVLHRVAEALAPIEPLYDVVIMDCPPQLGYLTLSALIASTSVLITVHPQMLDVASMAQFLNMLGDLLRTVAAASHQTRIDFDWLRYLITRFEPNDGPQNQMAAFLRLILGECILKTPTLKSTAISDAGITNQTIYEIDRSAVTKSTYDRAIDSVNAVNGEILSLISAAWSRP